MEPLALEHTKLNQQQNLDLDSESDKTYFGFVKFSVCYLMMGLVRGDLTKLQLS